MDITAPLHDRAFLLDEYDSLPAGRLCLEFANTAAWHASPHPEETLLSYLDLVSWSERIGILDAEAAEALAAQAATQPTLVGQVHSWALELREAIYGIFSAVAQGATVAGSDVDLLNEALAFAYTGATLAIGAPNFTWKWRGDLTGLDRMLWPVLRSAVRLLTESDLTRIGQCADDRGCGYLFYDTSRNRKRRWCDMGSCGNRAKAQRHYNHLRKRRPSSQPLPAEPQPDVDVQQGAN